MSRKFFPRVVFALYLILFLALPGDARTAALQQDEPRVPQLPFYWRHSSGRILGLGANGCLVLWKAPPGAGDHFAHENWGVCYQIGTQLPILVNGGSVVVVSLTSSEPGSVNPSGKLLSGNRLKVTAVGKSSDGLLQITHNITWKCKKDEILVVMQVRNISSQSLTLRTVKRWADLDVSGIQDNNWMITSHSIVAAPFPVYPTYGVIMSGLSPLVGMSCPGTVIDTGRNDYALCYDDTWIAGPVTGNFAGQLGWYFDTAFAPGQTFTVKMHYRIIR